MQSPPPPSAVSSSGAQRYTGWHGILTGLVPLALLALVAIVTVGVTVLARQLLVNQGFLVEQQVVAPVYSAGVAVAAIVYAVACFRVLRRVSRWQRAGNAAPAAATLWALVISALIVLLPILLVLIIPQHPAPVL